MDTIKNLKVKIFADGADKAGMLEMYEKPYIQGLTTNPTLMRKAGVINYKGFCIDILNSIKDKPISFEVFSDDFSEIEAQALEIASWGQNAYVKIPVMNTRREVCYPTVDKLASQGVKLNVTALMTIDQVQNVSDALHEHVPSYISVFAGRIADTGRDPLPIISNAVEIMKEKPASELIWASTREMLNIFQAEQAACHIITVTNDILKKLDIIGYDLENYSHDTVKMFYEDARAAGYKI